jgi:hypothetical protein
VNAIIDPFKRAEPRLREIAQLPALNCWQELDAVRSWHFGHDECGARAQLLSRELAHQAIVQKLSTQFPCPALLLKGEATARFLYPAPGLRFRTDVDLWIRAADQKLVNSWFSAQGAESFLSAAGTWIIPERCFALPVGALKVPVDLHWQILSRPALLPAFPWDEILASAHHLGGHLYLPSIADVLLHACTHRRAHHRTGVENRMGLIDIDLAFCILSEDQKADVAALAVRRGIASMLLDALEHLRILTQLSVDEAIVARLRSAATHEAARRLMSDAPPISDFRFDVATTKGRQRLQVLRDYLLPPSDYMKRRFATFPRPLRWLAYPWRLLRGMLWMRK